MNRSLCQTLLLVVASLFAGQRSSHGRDLAKTTSVPLAESSPVFESSARQVFKTHCFHCHGEAGIVEGGLDLRLRRLIVEGGETGPAVISGDPQQSYLLQRMTVGEMPPPEVTIRPTAEEISLVREWIKGGAKTARPEPEDPHDLPRIMPEERKHWAFQPILSTPIPTIQDHGNAARAETPVDHFLLRRLEQMGRGFSPEADKRTLIRRATFDLIGLPPTPEEVKEFIADNADGAYERLLDRLLATPRYGERWGRHWLDAVGYADSEGYSEADKPRPHAYKYRDYVINAFNDDVPFDRFIIEQIAGDELISSPVINPTSTDRQLLIATGFLRMAPDGTGSNPDDLSTAANAVVSETIKIVSSSLMGMTVGCAQCHDHRFDPILHEDYYRMRAIFEPALNPKSWRTPEQRQIQLATDEQRRQAEEIDKKVAIAQAEYDRQEAAFIEMVFERELRKLPVSVQESARLARDTAPGNRTAQQKQLLIDYPNLVVNGGTQLDLYLELFPEGIEAKKKLADMKKEISKLRNEKPEVDGIRALTETGSSAPQTYVFHRGDPNQPTEPVEPGGLTVLDHLLDVDIVADDSTRASTGRRLAFARQLTHPDNPLTARVIVNRIWMHHFGRALVPTPGDFGTQGEPPTHPELLDWLAFQFQRSGWSVKWLHRQIMLSAAYRQSSRRDDPGFDPENQYYSRQQVRRLEAETIRDAILCVSGQLSEKGRGTAMPVEETAEGQTIIEPDLDLETESCRSVYIQVRRSTPLAMLEVFDAPRLEPNCMVRSVSTVTPQSLMLMNSNVVVKQATAFGKRLVAEAGENVQTQISHAWHLAFAAAPHEDEIRAATAFLSKQEKHFSDQESENPRLDALSSMCQVLMGSNRFLYVD